MSVEGHSVEVGKNGGRKGTTGSDNWLLMKSCLEGHYSIRAHDTWQRRKEKE